MRRRGVTFKLFVMTTVCFLCFYAMVILSQLLLFENFYQNQKTNRVEKQLKSFAMKYAREQSESNSLSRNAASFILRNKSQLAIVTLDGKVKLDDPFQMKLKKDDGELVVLPLSLFMIQNGDQLRALGIKIGDQLTIEGDSDMDNVFYPTIYPASIYKRGSTQVGDRGDMEQISGVVTEIMLPDIKSIQRYGLLFEALEEWFPLSPARAEQLKRLEMQKEEWTDSWSGIRNAVIIQPVMQSTGNIDLLFTVTSLQEISDTNEALRWFYLYLGIGGFVLILILSMFFSKLVTRPLITLNNTAKRMVHLDFKNQLPIRQNDELGNLSNSLFTLAQNLDIALCELKESNQQLVEEIEQKHKMEVIQQDFFANASHELKTPLSIIKGFAEGLQDGVGIGKHDHYVRVIIEESGKIEMLVKDMLDLAKLESGTTKLHKTAFMLSELTEKVVEKMVHLLEGKKLEVVIILANESSVNADLGWMEQVVVNFLTNAIRHAEEGSAITINIKGLGKTSTFAIENKGETIPEGQLDKIWERFYRTEFSRNRLTGGTGLGLSITQSILDMHGFHYIAENTQDGVRFTVTLEENM